jgi:hypothetical protein
MTKNDLKEIAAAYMHAWSAGNHGDCRMQINAGSCIQFFSGYKYYGRKNNTQ